MKARLASTGAAAGTSSRVESNQAKRASLHRSERADRRVVAAVLRLLESRIARLAAAPEEGWRAATMARC